MGKFEKAWNEIMNGAELTPSADLWQAIDSKLWLNENSGFESGWRNKFQDAELEPSHAVWRSIDTELVFAENSRMKIRNIAYRRLAAASVGVLVLMTSYFWVASSKLNDTQLSNAKTSPSQSSNLTESQKNVASEVVKEDVEADLNQKMTNPAENRAGLGSSREGNQTGSEYARKNDNQYSSSRALTDGGINTRKSQNAIAVDYPSELSSSEKRNFNFSQGPISELTLLDVDKLPNFFGPNDYAIAYRIADAMPVVRSKRKFTSPDNKWAAVSFAAGTFSPGIGNSEMMTSNRSAANSAFADLKSNQSSLTKSEDIKSGTSLSMAVSAGKRIFKRLILQGGVSYLKQTSASNTEVVSVAPANQVYTLASFSPESVNTVTYPTQQQINSTFQFVSVPVQLGYMLVDRKFGIQLNGGFSPDFFISNSVYNETTQVEAVNTAGEDGTFNRVSLAGLGSVEFSYKFLSHYRLSLVPGVKYSLTSIYNENTYASAKPFVADIGLRFRYIF